MDEEKKKRKREYDEKYRKEHKEDMKKYHQKHKEKRKKYYQEHREEKSEWQKSYHDEQRKQSFLLLGGKCFICGEEKKERLLFHKKDGESHKEVAGRTLVLRNPSDFVLLCRFCHEGVHWNMKYLKMSWERLCTLLVNKKEERLNV